MRWAVTIVGAVLIILGGLWILQGINVIPVGFMAGQAQYAVLGAVVVVIGIGLLALSNRRGKGQSSISGSDKSH